MKNRGVSGSAAKPAMNQYLVLVLMAVLVFGLTFPGCGRHPQKKLGSPTAQESVPTVGQPLAAFTLEDRNGQSVNVPANFAGKAVYLTFFSTG
jgi:cytochrome oxidase Cu insertion factor (SCO1/SenC/PrrC family)